MFRTVVVDILGFIAGAIATYAVVLFGTLLVWDLTGVHDRDGGGAMGLAFVIAPVVALLGGVAGAVAAHVLVCRHRVEAVPDTPIGRQRDRRRLLVAMGAVLGGLVGHYAARFGFWLASPIQFDAYWKAWAFSWLPTIAVILGAIAGWLIARRMVRGRGR